MKKANKNIVASSSSSSSIVNVSIDQFPAVPLLVNRLMKLNHTAETIAAKKAAIEAAIAAAPVNLAILADEKRITDFINHNALIGVTIDRQSAMVALQIVRNGTPIKLDNTSAKRRVSVSAERSTESLELKPNDVEILSLYKQYGFMTHTDFVQKIQQDNTAVSSAVLSRYSNIAKQIAYLQGKQSNNGYLKDIQTIGCTPIEMLEQLSNHDKYHEDKTTFALTKRAVRIWAAMTE